jgi:protein-disulfide isomerase
MKNLANTLLNVLTVCLAALAVALGGVRVYQLVSSGDSAAKPEVVANWKEAGASTIEIGERGAPVTLVMYSDFLCVHCRAAAPVIGALRAEFGTQVRFVLRNLPLQRASFSAAVAAVCAHEQGAFDPVHEFLFANPTAVRSLPWQELPDGLMLRDEPAFLECLRSARADSAVARDTLHAMTVGVEGTPAFLVDSLLFRGNVGRDALHEAISSSLGRSRSIWSALRGL